MELDAKLSAIESCSNLEQLKAVLQRIIEDYGFAAYNFLDAGDIHADEPFYFGTSGASWEQDYLRNNFVVHDPCVARARVSNIPFTWSVVRNSAGPRRGPKDHGVKAFEAASDHGFTNGLVVPCHFRDHRGRIHTSSNVFFWKSKAHELAFMLRNHKHELHIIMLYWVQRAVDLVAEEHRGRISLFRNDANAERYAQLTEREREVLTWAARGKTSSEMAEIMNISDETVDYHFRNVMEKLGVPNRTAAVAQCIYMGVIQI